MTNRIITYWNSGSMTFDPPLDTFAEFVPTNYPSRATLESAASSSALNSGYYSVTSYDPEPILTYWNNSSSVFNPSLTLWDCPLPTGSAPQFDGIVSYNWSIRTLDGTLSGSTLVTSGSSDYVQLWFDEHNSTYLSASAATNRPLYEPTENSVIFDGVDDFLKSNEELRWTSRYHLFAVVANSASLGTVPVILSSEAINSSIRWFFNRGAARVQATIWLNNAVSTVFPFTSYASGGENTFGLYEIDANLSDVTCVVDGISGTPVALSRQSSAVTQVLHVGGRTDTPSDPCNFRFKELIIYMGDLTPTQISEVQTFLNTEHGL